MMGNLLTAFSGAKLSDSNVDKIYGIKTNEAGIGIGVGEHQTFAGSDRPKFHKTVDGFEQVVVEREATNLISAGQAQQADDTQSDWAFSRATTLNYDTVFGKNVARHQFADAGSGSNLIQTIYFPLSGSTAGRTFSMSAIVRRQSGISSVGIRIRGTGGANSDETHTSPAIPITNEFALISYTTSLVQDDRTGVRFVITAGEAGDVDIVAGLHMPIESAYPVLFTEGTRLAPNSVIENALPETGNFSILVDIVRVNGMFIFDNPVVRDTATERTILQLNSSNRFVLIVFGSTGGNINIPNPFSWNQFERKTIVIIPSWNNSNLYLWLCDADGNLYGYESSNAINISTDRNLLLHDSPFAGSARSGRFMRFNKSTDVIDTAQKAKDYIESLTVGTLNLKASEITHQNP